MNDSTSDWDSMSEPAQEEEDRRGDEDESGEEGNERQFPKNKSNKSHKQAGTEARKKLPRAPPFDFSDEISPDKSLSSNPKPPPGKNKPRKAEAYRPNSAAANKSSSLAAGNGGSSKKFSSPAARRAAGASSGGSGSRDSREDPFSASQKTVVLARGAVGANANAEVKKPKEKRKKRELTREDTDAQFSNLEMASNASSSANNNRSSRQQASASSSSKASGAPGLDNPAFQASYSFDIEEREDGYATAATKKKADDREGATTTRPVPEESFYVYTFEAPTNKYFQVDLEGGRGTWGDRLVSPISSCCTWCLAELFGIIKIPFVLIILFLGQLLMFLVEALLRPASDFLLKPCLVSCHNLALLPACGWAHNCCGLCADALAPICALCCGRSAVRGGQSGERRGEHLNV